MKLVLATTQLMLNTKNETLMSVQIESSVLERLDSSAYGTEAVARASRLYVHICTVGPLVPCGEIRKGTPECKALVWSVSLGLYLSQVHPTPGIESSELPDLAPNRLL